jgi:hypothetical protein
MGIFIMIWQFTFFAIKKFGIILSSSFDEDYLDKPFYGKDVFYFVKN